MDWGDIVRFTRDGNESRGVVHFIDHNTKYVELVLDMPLFTSPENGIDNEAWISFIMDENGGGISNDVDEITRIEIVHANEERSFIKDRNIELDDIVYVVSHKGSDLNGRRYTVEDLGDDFIELDDLDAEEDTEVIRLDISHGLSIKDGFICDLVKDEEGDEVSVVVPTEYREKNIEENILFEERELTKQEKGQWVFDTFSYVSKSTRQMDHLVKRTLDIIEDVAIKRDFYLKPPYSKWKDSVAKWDYFTPYVLNKKRPDLDGISLDFKDAQRYYDMYLSETNGYVKNMRRLSTTHSLYCPEPSNSSPIRTFEAIGDEGNTFKVLGPMYLPRFYTDQSGHQYTEKNLCLFEQECYSYGSSVRSPFGDTRLMENIIPSPEEFMKEWRQNNTKDFLKYYSISYENLPKEYAYVPSYSSTLPAHKKGIFTYNINKKKTGNKTLKRFEHRLQPSKFQASLGKLYDTYTNIWSPWKFDELEPWNGMVWETDLMMKMLPLNESDSRVVVCDLRNENRPFRLGEYHKKNGKYHQLQTIQGKERWVPKNPPSDGVSSVCAIEEAYRLVNEVELYAEGKYNSIDFKKNSSKWKKKPAIEKSDENSGYVKELISSRAFYSLASIQEKLDYLSSGIGVRYPREMENEYWYYDIATGKPSIPRHEYDLLLIEKEPHLASKHMETMLQKWAEPNQEGNWVSKANGDVLHVFHDQRDFGEGMNYVSRPGFDKDDTFDTFDDNDDIDEELDELDEEPDDLDDEKIKEIEGKDIKTKEKLSKLLTEIRKVVKINISNIDILFQQTIQVAKHYNKKGDISKQWSSFLVKILYKHAPKSMNISSQFVRPLVSAIVKKEIDGTPVSDDLKYLLTSNFKNIKEKIKKDNRQKFLVEFETWLKEDLPEFKTKVSLNKRYHSYEWVGFRPNKRTMTTRFYFDKLANSKKISVTFAKKIQSQEQPINRFKKIKHANTKYLYEEKKRDIGFIDPVDTLKEMLNNTLDDTWIELKDTDLTKPSGNFEDSWIFSLKFSKEILKYDAFYKFMRKSWILITSALSENIFNPRNIPSHEALKILPGIHNIMMKWNKVDEEVVIGLHTQLKTTLKGDEDKMKVIYDILIDNFTPIFSVILNYKNRNDKSLNIVHLNVWILMWKHLLEEVDVPEQLSYPEYRMALKSIVDYVTGLPMDTFFSDFDLGYNEKEIEEAVAFNAELEREEFLKFGAAQSVEEEEVDKVLKTLKMGRWSAGMTAVWKVVEDYDTDGKTGNVMGNGEGNIHVSSLNISDEGESYEYEGIAENFE